MLKVRYHRVLNKMQLLPILESSNCTRWHLTTLKKTSLQYIIILRSYLVMESFHSKINLI